MKKNLPLLVFSAFFLALSAQPLSYGAEASSGEGTSAYVLSGGGGLSEQQRYDIRKSSILGLASVDLPAAAVHAARAASGKGSGEGK